MPIPTMIREVAVILMTAVVLSLMGNALSPKGIALVGHWDTQEGVVSAKAKDDVVHRDREINDLRTARVMFDQGDRLFVDARRETDYRAGHIRGAVSLPVKRFDELIGDFWASHPLDTPLVIYCSGRLCEDSHQLAELLGDAGYSHTWVLVDGFASWKAAGFPIQ